jgi:tRNA pseudouridine38-40 synthase
LPNVKLIVEYDGTDFSGWGKQPGKRTVQGCLEEAVKLVTGERARLTAASRTDAGVHAKGQVVSFKTGSKIPLKRLPRVLQGALPGDLAVRSAGSVSAKFSARFSAKKKLYSYFIACGHDVPVGVRRHVWQVVESLDVSRMKRAARELVGRHDFTSFALTDKRRKLVNPYREIYSIRFSTGRPKMFFGELGDGSSSKIIKIDFLGNSFLYKMIRSLVGTLADVGRGKIRAKDIKGVLSERRRSAAGRTAPAGGLSLRRVFY